MATTAPPSYEAAMADVERIKAKITIDTQKKAEAAMAAEFEKPETNKKLLDEVKALGDSTIKIDQSFTKVSSQLKDVDDNDYKGKNGKPVPKLKPQWDDFHERYKHILWSSRDVATDTAGYILEFYKVYLPVIDEAIDDMATQSPAERIETIKSLQPEFDKFLEKQNPATAKSNRPAPTGTDPLSVSQVQSQDFLDLKNDMIAFKNTFSTFAEGTSDELEQKLASVKRKITDLETKIDAYGKVIKALKLAISGTALVAGVGTLAGLIAFGPAGPIVAVGVMIAGVLAIIGETAALITFLEKKSAAEDDLGKAKAEKKSLEDQLAVLQALKSKLEDQTVDINYITGRLDQFANIWSLVSSDARECNTLLKNASESQNFYFLKIRVKLLKGCYSSLYSGLKEYASKVTDSDVPRPKTK